MNDFRPFSPEGFMLLELNKFNDSKEFYDSVKEDIKAKVIVPMRSLCASLSDELYAIDDKMNLIPTKMVSRIRRDTRYSKNKELYRANVWCMFMRDKHQWNYQPCMWFEVYPGCYDFGVGTFRGDAAYLECFRETLKENQSEFIKAIKSAQKVGGFFEIEGYKKEKPGTGDIDESIRKFYNCKGFWFTHHSSDVECLYNGEIRDKLSEAIRAFTPMYRFLLKVTEKMYEKGEYIE